jgi:predicted methyltransferase
MLKPLLVAVVGSMMLMGCAGMGSGSADHSALYAAAIADPQRPAEEVARDALRAPAAMLAFAEVSPGDKIADIRPGAGYFTRLFAPVVGPTGKVYAFVPNRTAERENPRADILVAAYPNVTRVNGLLDSMSFPEPLDVVFMSQEYHDFHIPAFETDVARMNAAIFAALKPGGYFIVIDHAGRAGTTNTEVLSLHRIEGDFLRREVEAAGFVFDGQSTAVANPADDRTINVFEPAIRGRTDQFVYRFRKPG